MPVGPSGLLLAFLLWGGTPSEGAGQGGPGLPERSNLRAAAGRADITPPVGTRLAGFASRTGPSTSVRDPLQAVVLLLDDGATRAAIVTLDLLGAGYDETAAVRAAVAGAAAVPEPHVLVAASHTHAGPPFSAGDDYGRVVVATIASAARDRRFLLGVPGGTARRDPVSGPWALQGGSRRPARGGSTYVRRRSERITPHEGLSPVPRADTSPVARLGHGLEGAELKRDWPPAAGSGEAGERPSRAFGDDRGCA